MGNIKINFRIVMLLSCFTILYSCSIEKRLYNKGYHVQKHHLPQRNDKNEVQTLIEAIPSNGLEIKEKDSVQSEESISMNPVNAQTDCDTVYLLNREKLIGNVVLKNERWLVLDDCDSNLIANPTVYLKDIETIHYAYGEIEPINDLTPEVEARLKKEERKKQTQVRPLFYIANAFFVAAIITFLIIFFLYGLNYTMWIPILYFMIAAFVLSIISLVYHGKRRKKLGIYLSVGQLFLALLGVVVGLIALS